MGERGEAGRVGEREGRREGDTEKRDVLITDSFPRAGPDGNQELGAPVGAKSLWV